MRTIDKMDYDNLVVIEKKIADNYTAGHTFLREQLRAGSLAARLYVSAVRSYSYLPENILTCSIQIP